MKKHLLVMSSLVVAGSAAAQSSVTIWGVVDAALTHGSGSIASRSSLTNSGLLPGQLGFRGVEDLGGGLKAGFWLEGWINNDDGTGRPTNTNNQTNGSATAPAGTQGFIFNRRSTVSMGGDWGEIRLGREYVPQFWNVVVYDPFLNLGVGSTQTLLSSVTFSQGGGAGPAVRASNSVSYLYNMPFNNTSTGGPGFHAMAMYYMGENASNSMTSRDGTGYGARFGYSGGPFTTALGIGKTNYAAGDIHQMNLGGSYDFGVVKLIGHIARDKYDAATGAIRGKGYLVGGTAPIGTNYVRFDYSHYRNSAGPATGKFALGYVHNLSKRTALYGTIARAKNSGGAASALGGGITAPNGSSTGYDLGIKHSF